MAIGEWRARLAPRKPPAGGGRALLGARAQARGPPGFRPIGGPVRPRRAPARLGSHRTRAERRVRNERHQFVVPESSGQAGWLATGAAWSPSGNWRAPAGSPTPPTVIRRNSAGARVYQQWRPARARNRWTSGAPPIARGACEWQEEGARPGRVAPTGWRPRAWAPVERAAGHKWASLTSQCGLAPGTKFSRPLARCRGWPVLFVLDVAPFCWPTLGLADTGPKLDNN